MLGALQRRRDGTRRRRPSFDGRTAPLAVGVAAWAIVGGALLVAGCGADAAAPPPSSTDVTRASVASTAAPATTRPMTDEEQVIATYQAFWDTWFAANNPPNPDHPDLDRYATGPAGERARTTIERHQQEGLQFRRPEASHMAHRVSEVQIAGDDASLIDCSIDDGIQYQATTGSVVNDAVITQLLAVQLRRQNGDWKVFDVTLQKRAEGIHRCDEL